MNKYEFLKKYVTGRSLTELTQMYNDYFNTNVKSSTIKRYKIQYGLKSGVDTRFKKGTKPHNFKQDGYEFYDKQSGHWYIKINGKFVKKHIYLYEQYHNTKVQKNSSVIFLNSNKEDFSKDNLEMIENRDKLVMKNLHLFTTDKELTKTGILIAKLINKTYDKNNLERTDY